MKRILVIACVAVCLSPGLSAAELKVGAIVAPRLLTETRDGKEAAETMKKRVADARKALDAKLEEIKEFEEDIRARMLVLSDEEKKKLGEEHEQQTREARRLREDVERQLKKAEAEVMGDINERLRAVIQKFGEDNGYDLILDASSLVYASGAADITDEVIKAADASR